jgi:type II pantothenate kinase
MAIPRETVGIDAGATLCKVVHHEQTLRSERYSSRQLDRVREEVARLGPSRIAVTGGGASQLGEEIGGVRVTRIEEFEAWGRGAPILASLCGVELPPRYLLVSVGTGTSALGVADGKVGRVGGTALGGGTLLGLGRLLVQTESFSDLAALATQGDRRAVDLLVGDIYSGGHSPLPPDLTAANFAKVESTRREDLALALMGLVGENVALICSALARQLGAAAVLYCGSTVADNPALQAIMTQVTHMSGADPHFLPEGAYCGAVGAAALAAD